ncbi:Uncharacterised protein [Yersinia bercovieri]|uniref:hypothetical protein n=1 Tax=Yersinia bercovieri TaxID=634 RepID=UPI00061CA192|nr:hypothetical protein [Yersinia bercovieri]CNE41260.1 Uncharacterised protein [Yersinia bercovieri]
MALIGNYNVTPYSASYSNIDIQVSEKNDLMVNKAKVYINGVILSDHDNSREVLEQLVNKGWLNAANSYGESEERVNLLNLISKFSMAGFMLKHRDNDNKYPFLEHDSQISMESKYSSDSGLVMRYSVNCGDGESALFTLNWQIILGENFDLSGEGIDVGFVFEKDCPDDLKKDLDCQTLWQRIIDWFKNLFSQSSYITNNTCQVNYCFIKNNFYESADDDGSSWGDIELSLDNLSKKLNEHDERDNKIIEYINANPLEKIDEKYLVNSNEYYTTMYNLTTSTGDELTASTDNELTASTDNEFSTDLEFEWDDFDLSPLPQQ